MATGRGQLHAGDRPLVGEALQPYVDRATSTVLADHIRDGYPTYTDAQIDSGVNTWLVILSLVGALGITSWCLTIWALKSSKRWATGAASAMFAVGTSVALTALLVKDTSGDTGLAPLLGSIGGAAVHRRGRRRGDAVEALLVSRGTHGMAERAGALKRASSGHGRPGPLMRLLNRLDVATYGFRSLAPRNDVTLDVIGRRSGCPISLPVVVAELDG